MGKGDRIRKARDKKTLKYLSQEVKSLGIIRRAHTVTMLDLEIANHNKRKWKNVATIGIPIAALGGLALGIYIADTVMRNAFF